jgi:hypothetical protein
MSATDQLNLSEVDYRVILDPTKPWPLSHAFSKYEQIRFYRCGTLVVAKPRLVYIVHDLDDSPDFSQLLPSRLTVVPSARDLEMMPSVVQCHRSHLEH